MNESNAESNYTQKQIVVIVVVLHTFLMQANKQTIVGMIFLIETILWWFPSDFPIAPPGRSALPPREAGGRLGRAAC